MQFYQINFCQVVIFRLYTVYNKHEMIKIGSQTRGNRKYYRKFSNNFAADCSTVESKNIRALEKSRDRKLMSNAIL